jgi:hypothetical protein
MSAKRGTLARILCDEFDFSGETASITTTLAISEEDCTVMTSTAAEYTSILAAINIMQDGYMINIGSDGSFEKELYERLGVQGSYVAALYGIDQPGHPAYVLDNTFGATMEIVAPATGVLAINGSWGQGKGGHRGLTVTNALVSATGSLVAWDTLGTGSAGGEAYVFVRAIGGTATGAILAVEHSPSEAGPYATLGTFTINGIGAQKLTFSGTVNRIVRGSLTSLGGATSLTFALIICARGVTE